MAKYLNCKREVGEDWNWEAQIQQIDQIRQRDSLSCHLEQWFLMPDLLEGPNWISPPKCVLKKEGSRVKWLESNLNSQGHLLGDIEKNFLSSHPFHLKAKQAAALG